MAGNRKRFRGGRAYLKDFERTPSGEFVYRGATYTYRDADGKPRRKALAELWLPGGLMLAAALVQGCLRTPGMISCVYVILPYVCELLCAVSVVWALVRLGTNPDPIREYVFRSTVAVLPLRSAFTAAFAGAALIGESVFLLVSGFDCAAATAALYVLLAVTCAAALYARRLARRLCWEKTADAAD